MTPRPPTHTHTHTHTHSTRHALVMQVPQHPPSTVWAGLPELELGLGPDPGQIGDGLTPRAHDSAADPGGSATQVRHKLCARVRVQISAATETAFMKPALAQSALACALTQVR